MFKFKSRFFHPFHEAKNEILWTERGGFKTEFHGFKGLKTGFLNLQNQLVFFGTWYNENIKETQALVLKYVSKARFGVRFF